MLLTKKADNFRPKEKSGGIRVNSLETTSAFLSTMYDGVMVPNGSRSYCLLYINSLGKILKTKINLHNHSGIQADIFFYLLPLILAALLYLDLINIVYLTALSGQCDIALELN